MHDDPSLLRVALRVTLLTLAVTILFASFPRIDLGIASLFYQNTSGEWIGEGTGYSALRDVLRRGTELLSVLTFVIFLSNLRLGSGQKTGWRVWAYLWGTVLLCSGIVVNGFFKTYGGRARPDAVLEFGGQQLFTPPFQFTDQCVANCSFSSGEASLVASFVLPLLVLVWPHLVSRGRRIAAFAGAGAIVLTSVLRMAAGRHFFSDVTMSVLFAALTTLLLYKVLDIKTHRAVFTADAVLHDVGVLLEKAVASALAGLRGLKPLICKAKEEIDRWFGRSAASSPRASDPDKPAQDS